MNVTFKSKQKALSVAHDEIFHVGVQPEPFAPRKQKDGSTKFEWIGSEDEWEERNKLPDPDMVNKAYHFIEGEDHNLLTLSNNEAIEGMRAYIKRRKDNLIVELDSED